MNNLYEKIRNNDVYFIAEMSANHGGSLETALEIVRKSAKIGADCIKIQTYTADSLTIDCDSESFKIKNGLWDGETLYNLYEKACTPYEWHKAIKEECEKEGVDFLSTPFDKDAVDFLEELNVEAYKVASFEVVDLPLIEYIASKHKPLIISTGMASLEEIKEAIDVCYKVDNYRIILLKCCSEYPASWDDMFLGNIPDLKKRFGVPVGLSDHSVGSLGAVVGATLGACIIEKHVKIDGVKSADSDFSMTIDEFGQMIQDVKNAKLIASGPCYELTEGEKESLIFRRSIFAVSDIKPGDVFDESNIRIIRPGNGLKPKYYEQLLGTVSKRHIKRGEPIIKKDL